MLAPESGARVHPYPLDLRPVQMAVTGIPADRDHSVPIGPEPLPGDQVTGGVDGHRSRHDQANDELGFSRAPRATSASTPSSAATTNFSMITRVGTT